MQFVTSIYGASERLVTGNRGTDKLFNNLELFPNTITNLLWFIIIVLFLAVQLGHFWIKSFTQEHLIIVPAKLCHFERIQFMRPIWQYLYVLISQVVDWENTGQLDTMLIAGNSLLIMSNKLASAV